MDLPTGGGIYYPVTIDKATAEVVDPPYSNYVTENLVKGLKNKRTGKVNLDVKRYSDRSEIVLVNCLDFTYGDSLHKLFNVQYYLDHCDHLGICALIPREVEHFVPDGIAEVWVADLPLRSYSLWHTSIEEQVRKLIREKKRAFLSIAYTHLHPTYYDIHRFVRVGSTDLSGLGSPIIVFGYREDRIWGRSLSDQRRNILRLHDNLRGLYPNMTFALIGFGKKMQFNDKILDKRTDGFDMELEQYWIDLASRTDCLIGVDGSNMQIASGLAKFVVELLPELFYDNYLQPFLTKPGETDWRLNAYRYRTLFGSNDLDDISPHRVAAVVSSQLDSWDIFKIVMSLEYQPRDNVNPLVDPMPATQAYAALAPEYLAKLELRIGNRYSRDGLAQSLKRAIRGPLGYLPKSSSR